MQTLPAGWSVKNSSGSFSGPPVPDEEDLELQEDYEAQGIDVRPDSPGWEDVNADDDREVLDFKCFLCDQTFNEIAVMVDHARETHQFDLIKIQKAFDLDYFATMKFVNYVRSAVASGSKSPDVSDPGLWSDEKFMQPALPDDAVLFSLEEILDFGNDDSNVAESSSDRPAGAGHKELASRSII